MTNEEFDKLCEELLAQGMDEKDILEIILQMFKDGKIDLEGMKKLAGARGYELKDEFIKSVEAPAAPAEGEMPSEEAIEDAQEVTPEEKSEESEPKDEGEEDEAESEDEESEEESEEDEKEEAKKLFNLD